MVHQGSAPQMTRQPIERNLAMELVRVTEAAALAAAVHMGKGDKELVDQAAVDAMRFTLDGIRMDGVVVIGEGEKTKLRCSITVNVSETAPTPRWTSL